MVGALGGDVLGNASPQFDLGAIGNAIAGLVGCGVFGQLVILLVPPVAAAA